MDDQIGYCKGRLGRTLEASVAEAVMAGLVPAIHAVDQTRIVEGDPARLRGGAFAKFFPLSQLNRVDSRDKPGHDG